MGPQEADAGRPPPELPLLGERPLDVADAFLPAYAPELSPEEQANAVLKWRMTNARLGFVRRGIHYLQHRSTMFRHFFRHAGLAKR